MIHRLLTRVFRLEEISGAGRCPTYLYRWTLLRLFGFGLYLHHFVADDWCLDLHDHPKWFVSLMLWGGYVETTAAGDRAYRAPYLRAFPAEHAHRLRLGRNRECWTLVLVGRASRPWGFWHEGVWLTWRDYVFGRFAYVADRMAACAGLESRRAS